MSPSAEAVAKTIADDRPTITLSRVKPKPPIFGASPQEIIHETHTLIARAEALRDKLTSENDTNDATAATVLLPLAHEENRRLHRRALIEFHADVSPDEEMRNASREAKRLFADLDRRIATGKELFALLNEAGKRSDFKAIGNESERLLSKMLAESQRNGLALSLEDQVLLKRTDEDLNRIEEEYLDNLDHYANATNSESYHVQELEGWHDLESTITERRDHDNDRCQVTLPITDKAQFIEIISSLRRSDVRRRVYRQFSERHHANVSLLKEAIVLRQRKAKLLGYSSYAAYTMSDRMEKSPETIRKFLEDLARKVEPARDSMLARMRQLKCDDCSASEFLSYAPEAQAIQVWDRWYYAKKIIHQDVSCSSQTSSIRIPLNQAVQRLLRLYEHLFSVKFTQIVDDTAASPPQPGAKMVWHEDVELYLVEDSSSSCSEVLGFLYLDLFARGGKRPGFADLPVHPVRERSRRDALT